MIKHNKLYLSLLLFIIICEAIFTGLLPLSRGYLFTLLSAKSGPILVSLGLYFLNYFAIDFFQSIKGYTVLKVALWYRDARTKFIRASLNTQFKINWRPEGQLADNSPQRIQEDIKLSYVNRITVWTEYAISGIILMQLFLMNLREPALVVFAVIYAVISIIIAICFNPRLTKAEINVQQVEASYRTDLVGSILNITRLSDANKTCLRSKWVQTEYLLFTKLQLGLVAVLPYLILLPKLLSGTIDLGTVVQHQASFSLIVVNAAILIQMYPILIQGTASEKRVKEI